MAPSGSQGQQLFSLLDNSSPLCQSWGRQGTVVVSWSHWSLVTAFMIVSLLVRVQRCETEVQDPCMGCRLFDQHHRLHAETEKKESEFCHYPCHCGEDLSCQDGVSTIKDGCGCCYMCARQMGDMCSIRDLCDHEKGLSCDRRDTNSTGVCKGKDKNPCLVGGVMYQDGEKFQPECSQLCTCQNGFYGCVNMCPQEMQKPSEVTCHEPKLMQVKNKCCKEWTCQKMEASGSSVLANNRLKSDNLVIHDPAWYYSSTFPPTTETTPLTVVPYQHCYKKTTDWTPCSVTCDVGVSIRLVVDTMTCNSFQELQLCYLRPCGTNIETEARDKCTPTTRSVRRYHIRYQDCISIKDYNLKFCTRCKINKCCYPHRTRTRLMEFQCSDGKRELYNFLWIKKCRCASSCDLRLNSPRHRGGGGGRGGSKTRKQARNKKKDLSRKRRFHL